MVANNESVEALESINQQQLGLIVLQVIESFGSAGCISDEVRAKLPWLAYSSVTARYAALLAKGLIKRVGRRRGNSGRFQSVMVATVRIEEQQASK